MPKGHLEAKGSPRLASRPTSVTGLVAKTIPEAWMVGTGDNSSGEEGPLGMLCDSPLLATVLAS